MGDAPMPVMLETTAAVAELLEAHLKSKWGLPPAVARHVAYGIALDAVKHANLEAIERGGTLPEGRTDGQD